MLRPGTCEDPRVLIALPIALVLVLAWIAWQSRERPYLSGSCCGHQQWPPDDISAMQPADDATATPPADALG